MTTTFKVDFHCHTDASPDSLVKPAELIATARARGLNRLVVTDHNTIRGALRCKELDPELIIVGEEVQTTGSELLAAFVTKEVPRDLEPKEAIKRLRDQGAFISVSHPFDPHRGWNVKDLLEIIDLVDAIEDIQRALLPTRNGICSPWNLPENTINPEPLDRTRIHFMRLVEPVFSFPLLKPRMNYAQSLDKEKWKPNCHHLWFVSDHAMPNG